MTWAELAAWWRYRPWAVASVTTPEDVAMAKRQATLALPLELAAAAARLERATPEAAELLAAVALLAEKAPVEFPRLLKAWAGRVEEAATRGQGASIEIGHRLSNGRHREFRWNPDAVI